MGAVAAWLGVAVAAGSAAYGASENEEAKDANASAQQASKDDYESRLQTTAKWAKKLQDQYNKIVKQRPSLDWATYVKEQIRNIDDPAVRNFYVNAKQEDFDNLQRFAEAATKNNTQSLLDTADQISGGRWRENMDRRAELINSTTAAQRYERANELVSPTIMDPSTVRYDEQRRLIEGQRADKQRFNIALEQQAAAEQEQKADLRTYTNDILSAAQSQQQKATDFLQFFDPTGFGTAFATQQAAAEKGYQALDEERAWSIYDKFAGSAAGITPSQPTYQNPNPGNAMIADAIKMGSSSIIDYYKAQQSKPKTTTTAPTSSGNAYA